MSTPAIRAEGLGKRYRLGQREKYVALRDVLAKTLQAPLGWLRGSRNGRDGSAELWALRDVHLEVRHGEVVGMIGPNGAGKTTLLKILSRITRPTTGRAEVYGRVGSLLEVGTGFHPELTGRENIYLNGAILGMGRHEITRKFDEMVAFAEVERFLDTPVKHYSTGMYVRLAFAVAAHLEPEILLVDEVLAVGDIAFQKKCLGKMGEVARQGRTVLFVSHNMAAVLNLCSRGILLEGGRVAGDGPASEVVEQYLRGLKANAVQDLRELRERRGRGQVRFTRVHFENGGGNATGQGVSGQPLVFVLDYAARNDLPLNNCRVAVVISDRLGQVMFNCTSELTNREPVNLPPSGSVRCEVPRLPLSQGQYHVAAFLEVNREIEDWIDVAAALDVVDGDFYGTGKVYPEGWRGKGVLVPHRWIWN
jgi:lipopolysaccharide transport system ATP-binding protein